MQHITLEEVKASCRQAYSEGRLVFQNTGDEYGYSIGNSRCAIGSALTYDTLCYIEGHCLQTYVIGKNSIAHDALRRAFTWDDEEEKELSQIQSLHDILCIPKDAPISEDSFERVVVKVHTREAILFAFLAAIEIKIPVVITHPERAQS